MTVISETDLPRSIALMGGSFDPVHQGHLLAAVAVKEALHVDQMRLLPCAQSPLKGRTIATASQRESMLTLALAAHPQLSLDTRELNQPGPTYTVNTLAQCRQKWGASTRIIFVLGWDSLQDLPRWYKWRSLLTYAHIAVVTRPGFRGYGTGQLGEQLKAFVGTHVVECADLLSNPCGQLAFICVPDVDLSSSELRAKLAAGEPVAGMIPDVVQQYIEQQSLYR